MKISRRQFLVRSITASALPLFSSIELALNATRAWAIAPVVIWIVSAVIQAISAFTKSDSGMGVMLRAENAKLDIIVDQLQRIQSSIETLLKRISELPGFIEDQFKINNVRQLVNAVNGATFDYIELARGENNEYDLMKSPRNIDRIKDIEKKLRAARTQLMALSGNNRGPSVGCIVPLAFSVEVNCRRLQNDSEENIKSTAQSYLDWITRMSAQDDEISIIGFMKRQRAIIDNNWKEINDFNLTTAYDPASQNEKNSRHCMYIQVQDDVKFKGRPTGVVIFNENVTFSKDQIKGVLLDRIVTVESKPKHVNLGGFKSYSEQLSPYNLGPCKYSPMTMTMERSLTDEQKLERLEGAHGSVRDKIKQAKLAVDKSNMAKLNLVFASSVLISLEKTRDRIKNLWPDLGG